MSEFMGNLYGQYDSKMGFVPGGASLHSMMTPHGPDKKCFEVGVKGGQAPVRLGNNMAFMFETSFSVAVTEWAMVDSHSLDKDYYKCWQGMRKTFDPNQKPQQEGE